MHGVTWPWHGSAMASSRKGCWGMARPCPCSSCLKWLCSSRPTFWTTQQLSLQPCLHVRSTTHPGPLPPAAAPQSECGAAWSAPPAHPPHPHPSAATASHAWRNACDCGCAGQAAKDSDDRRQAAPAPAGSRWEGVSGALGARLMRFREPATVHSCVARAWGSRCRPRGFHLLPPLRSVPWNVGGCNPEIVCV